MKSVKNENPVFYGIAVDNKYPINSSVQRVYFKLLFLNPKVSTQKAKLYLNENFYYLHLKFILESMNKEIENWSSEERKGDEKLHIEMQLIEKIELWTKEFSLPLPGEVCELAKIAGISEINLFQGIYSLFLSGKFPPKAIIDFLRKYSNNISDRLIDKMLDKYNSMKPKRKFLFKNFF